MPKKPKPCQTGYSCIWGKSVGNKITCAFSRCVIENPERNQRELIKMMQSKPKRKG